MKSHLLFNFFLVCLFTLIFTQINETKAQTIQLGSGTATNGTTTSSPVNIYYRRTASQFVYTVAELNAAGILALVICKTSVGMLHNHHSTIFQVIPSR